MKERIGKTRFSDVAPDTKVRTRGADRIPEKLTEYQKSVHKSQLNSLCITHVGPTAVECKKHRA